MVSRGSVTVFLRSITTTAAVRLVLLLLFLLLECCSAVAAALLTHCQATENAHGEEEYCTAQSEWGECVFQVTNAARGAAAYDNDLGGQRRWLHHNTNWCRLECSIVGHVIVERRSRCTMMNSGYVSVIC